MKKTTREWVRKAENDFQFADGALKRGERHYDQICFLCQQSSEKFLKALMEEIGLTVPKTHNLDGLRIALQPHCASLRSFRRGLLFRTDFAVDSRYPGNWTTKRQAHAAHRWAALVRQECRTILGIKPPRKKKP